MRAFAVLPAILVLVLGACQKAEDEAPAPSASDLERAIKARELWDLGMSALVPDKVAPLKKLIALYPESEFIPQATERLVLTLLQLERFEEAFVEARRFSDRNSKHFAVANSLGMVLMAHHQLPADQKVLDEVQVLDVREGWLDRALAESPHWEECDVAFLHFVRGAHHLDRAGVQPERKDEQYAKASAAFAEATRLNFDPNRSNFLVESAWYLGRIAAVEGRKEDARAHFEQALAFRRKWNWGWPEDEIQKQIEALGLTVE